jgi:hypothetical protein
MKKFINSAINFVDQINWHEVGQAIVKAVAFTYTLGYCLGLWVHRTNAQLSAAHVAVVGLKPTATVEAPTLAAASQPAEQQPTAPVAPTAPAAPHLPVLAPAPRRRVSLADWLQADGWDEEAVEALVCRRPRPQGIAA